MEAQPDKDLVAGLVDHYRAHMSMFSRLGENLFSLVQDERIRPLIHSARWRAKDPEHLRDKLFRKVGRLREEGKEVDLTEANLFERVNDLAGLRILHLHTNQFPAIDRAFESPRVH